MANAETKQLDSIISSRRAMLAVGGAALASLAFAPKAQAATVSDNDILNFALNLEYLEAQFYTLAVFGVTIDQLPTPIAVAVNGGTAGTVTLKPNFVKVPFTDPLIAAYAMETAIEEGKHVSFLQTVLNTNAVSMPNIDLYNSFNTLAVAAGLPITTFDPFGANAGGAISADASFLLGAFIFEDTGVSAYHGAAPLISDKKGVLPAAVGIHAVEAYHAGLVRTSINRLDGGTDALNAVTRLIAAARVKLATGSSSTASPFDTGISSTATVALNSGSATFHATTIVDADITASSIAQGRTVTQILQIVTGMTTAPVAPATPAGATAKYHGVFFPTGLNGNIGTVAQVSS